MNTLAIDPGINGAWAVVDALGRLQSASDLPVAGEGAKRMVSGALFVEVLKQFRPALAVIERVGARPGEGGTSLFRFGRACGIAEGVIAGQKVPVRFVTPQVWKRHFRLSGEKEDSRQLAIETWPDTAPLIFNRKRDHQRAEAALMALWAVRAVQAAGGEL